MLMIIKSLREKEGEGGMLKSRALCDSHFLSLHLALLIPPV